MNAAKFHSLSCVQLFETPWTQEPTRLLRDWAPVSHIAGRHFTVWATREATGPGAYEGFCGVSQVALVVKNLPANAGDIREVGLIPGLGRFPGEGHGNPLQYFCLETMDRRAWQATVHRVAKKQTRLKWLNTQAIKTCRGGIAPVEALLQFHKEW